MHFDTEAKNLINKVNWLANICQRRGKTNDVFKSLILDNYYTDEDSMNNNVAKSEMKTMSKGGEQGDWMKQREDGKA